MRAGLMGWSATKEAQRGRGRKPRYAITGRLERVAFIRIHAMRSNLLISHVREPQNRFPLLSNML
jgi:predicted methyltransferase